MTFKNGDRVVFIKNGSVLVGLNAGVSVGKLNSGIFAEIVDVKAGTKATVIHSLFDEIEIRFDTGKTCYIDNHLVIHEEGYNTPLYHAMREED